MFEKTSHDFGTVPHGAPIDFRFSITNPYKDDVHIAGVRASCGCTTPTLTKQSLQSGEQGEIVAQFNADRFLGKKGATLTVTFDRPKWAEVQLRVDGYIRSDLVVTPGEVNFGTVDQGVERQLRLNVAYAGPRTWQIIDTKCDSPYVRATVTEAKREANEVGYELLVTLSDEAPTGYLNAQLTLVTNEPNGNAIPVVVQGRILGALTVSPTALSFGAVAMGDVVTKQMVVRAKQPFRIIDMRCDDPTVRCEPTSESKSVHVVPVTFSAAQQTGRIATKIQITTDCERATPTDVAVIADIYSPPR